MDEIIKAPPLSRRRLLGALIATGAAAAVGPRISAAQPDAIITRPIPSTDEKLPAVGLGSWITFNVGYDDGRVLPAPKSCETSLKRAAG